jgi:hypothetical protein
MGGIGAPSRHERMFAPIAAGFLLVDTERWFWIRTVGAPRDGAPRDGELHQSTREGATFLCHSVETELVTLDVLHHEARLVVAIGTQ